MRIRAGNKAVRAMPVTLLCPAGKEGRLISKQAIENQEDVLLFILLFFSPIPVPITIKRAPQGSSLDLTH